MDSNASRDEPAGIRKEPIFRRHQDKIVLVCGFLFFGCFLGVMFGLGAYREWNAESGYSHNYTLTSQQRFLEEPFMEDFTIRGRSGLDRTGRWYYWKLKPELRTMLSRILPWLGYVLHQTTYWFGLYMLQTTKRTVQNLNLRPEETVPALYSSQLSCWNWFLFITNLLFHAAHLAVTHTTYDGLAADVCIPSSQTAMIMVLVFIMIIEYRDRGLFFGWPAQHHHGVWSMRLKLTYAPMYLVRRYHGYAFSWAAIYTFWYHTMENTYGHALGIAHTFMFTLQGSLAFTPMHLNKYWRFILETWVTLHGGLVAVQTGGPMMKNTALWPMFLFGFSLLVVVTQIFGLPFWRKVHWLFRTFPLIFFLTITIYCYSWIPDRQGRVWVRMQEIIRIPAIYYAYVFVEWLWIFILIKIDQCCHKKEEKNGKPSKFVHALAILSNVIIYAFFVFFSFWMEYKEWPVAMFVSMVGLTLMFTSGCAIGFILLRQIFGVFDGRVSIPNTEYTVNEKHTLEGEFKGEVGKSNKAFDY